MCALFTLSQFILDSSNEFSFILTLKYCFLGLSPSIVKFKTIASHLLTKRKIERKRTKMEKVQKLDGSFKILLKSPI
jgi:hypothetical protein